MVQVKAIYELRNTRYWKAIDVLDSGCLIFLELDERKKLQNIER
jgi:hypothetical protein